MLPYVAIYLSTCFLVNRVHTLCCHMRFCLTDLDSLYILRESSTELLFESESEQTRTKQNVPIILGGSHNNRRDQIDHSDSVNNVLTPPIKEKCNIWVYLSGTRRAISILIESIILKNDYYFFGAPPSII